MYLCIIHLITWLITIVVDLNSHNELFKYFPEPHLYNSLLPMKKLEVQL